MKRILSFDLARGFTVLMMPVIHVVMLYSKPGVQQSLLGDILGFIAEGPGAQLFMLLMGVMFALKSPSNFGAGARRSLILLTAAYLLNFFKFIVPLALGLMPENLLQELQMEPDLKAAGFFLLIGDILHFAAIAYVILFFVHQSKYYPFLALALAVAVMWFSPYIWDLKTDLPFIDQVLILFNGHPPQTFFPVFPWLVYPLMGLVLGYLLKDNNVNYLLSKTGIIGIGIIVISCLLPPTTKATDWLPFYRTQPADTLFHLGFVLTWLAVFNWLSNKIPTNPIFKLLTFCSKNITAIYIIQWILICWCLVFTGYLQLNMISTLIWMTGITTATLLLTHSLNNAYRKSL